MRCRHPASGPGRQPDKPQRLVAFAAAWTGENHHFDIVGNSANSNDFNGPEVAWLTVAFQPHLGTSISEEDLALVYGMNIPFHDLIVHHTPACTLHPTVACGLI
jgi:hypothetical protein